MTYYIGQTPDPSLANDQRFFYALRRTDDGDLYFVRTDQVVGTDIIQINNSGDNSKDFPNFESGGDFFEGRDAFHNIVYENAGYEQFRWDKRNIYYYVDDEGQLSARINTAYPYRDDVAP
jgi:hypothetical protein